VSTSPEERLDAIVVHARKIVQAKRDGDPRGVIDGAAAISSLGDRIFQDFSDDDWNDRDPLARYADFQGTGRKRTGHHPGGTRRH
jgi:hypothetical protein